MRLRFLSLWLVAVLAAAALIFSPTVHVSHASPNGIVISAIYGGGGDDPTTPYNNDYIELFNAGSVAVDMTDWTIQHRDTHADSSWEKTFLVFDPPGDGPNNVLQPGQYLLTLHDMNNDRGDTPPADIIATSSLSPFGNSTIALMRTNTSIAFNASPYDALVADVEDVFGGGDSTVFEGAAATGGVPFTDDNTAWYRNNHGCTDTNNNNSDFTAGTAYPNARNTSTPLAPCITGSPSIELISNGGFESGSTDWTLTGSATVKCNGFGSGSDCGLKVKTGGSAKQQNMFDDALGSTLAVAGDTLQASASVKSPTTTKHVFLKIIVQYVNPTDGLLNNGKDKFKLKVGTTIGYATVSKSFVLDGTITNGTVSIAYWVSTGKIAVDNVSVMYVPSGPRGVLPLPPALQ